MFSSAILILSGSRLGNPTDTKMELRWLMLRSEMVRRRTKPRVSSSWSEMENLLTGVWVDDMVTFRVVLRRREGRGVVEMMPRRSIARFSFDFVEVKLAS